MAGYKEAAIAENLFRRDLTPVELAGAIQDILGRRVMDIDQLASAMNRSRHWVLSQVELLSWPADVLDSVQAGALSVSAAHNLALITDDEYRGFLLRNARDSGATARITAAWLQAWRAMEPPEVALNSEPADGTPSVPPAVPQAPCIACGTVSRTDALSMVMICTNCINAIRRAGSGG